ncbi:hypothetical protein pdam_00003176, partial [Pocillopora damicornis]
VGACWLCCLTTSSLRARSWSRESGCFEWRSFKALINTGSISTELLATAILVLCSIVVPSLPIEPNMSATEGEEVLNAGGQTQKSEVSAVALSTRLQKLMLKIEGNTFLFQSVMQIEVGYNESAIIFRQLSHIEWIP